MTENRYFLTGDPHRHQYGDFQIPPDTSGWYFRPYEYLWVDGHLQPDQCVLDAGCGVSHRFKYHLASRCRQVLAVDSDPRIHSLNHAHGNLATICCGLSHPPLSFRGAFDAIVCVSVLEHAQPEIPAILAAFARSLKPAGRVLITFDAPRLDPIKFHSHVTDSPLAFVGPLNRRKPVHALDRGILAGGEPDGYSVFRCILTSKPPIGKVVKHESDE